MTGVREGGRARGREGGRAGVVSTKASGDKGECSFGLGVSLVAKGKTTTCFTGDTLITCLR